MYRMTMLSKLLKIIYDIFCGIFLSDLVLMMKIEQILWNQKYSDFSLKGCDNFRQNATQQKLTKFK